MFFPRWFGRLALLAAAVLLPFTALAQSFGDVPIHHKNHLAISQLSDLGVINGYGNGQFRPSNVVSRAEAAKMLITSTKPPTFVQDIIRDLHQYGNSLVTFWDVPASEWHAPYVTLARQYGVVNGYADGSFRPHQTINFAEGLKMILEAYHADTASSRFSPKPLLYVQGNEWFAPYFEYAYQKNLINREKFYHPAQSMTRGEFAEVLYRMRTVKSKALAYYTPTQKPFSSEYTITIPGLDLININVSFADPYNSDGALAVLKDGLGHYLSPPGSGKKMVIFGHSSGFNWDTSGFKQVLRQINKLNHGDVIYLNYQEKGYAYRINKQEIMPANQLVSVMSDYGYEELAIYTCWPPDSVSHRYVVYATPI
jgi:LPXTG-site transpeptidase (sortase) family protein